MVAVPVTGELNTLSAGPWNCVAMKCVDRLIQATSCLYWLLYPVEAPYHLSSHGLPRELSAPSESAAMILAERPDWKDPSSK